MPQQENPFNTTTPVSEIDAWQAQRNLQKAKINWGFSKHNADEKLQKYYT